MYLLQNTVANLRTLVKDILLDFTKLSHIILNPKENAHRKKWGIPDHKPVWEMYVFTVVIVNFHGLPVLYLNLRQS